MLKSDALFDLIKSLQQAEKRYFRLFAQRHVLKEQNYYLELFDLIDAMKSYQEAVLRTTLSNPVFAKNLSSSKHYLYNLILKSLRSYHSGKSAKIKLQELLIEIQILMERELFEQAMKRIRKAEQIAQTYQYYIDHLNIVVFKRRIIRRLAGKKLVTDMESWQQQSHHLLEQINIDEEILTAYEKAFISYRIRDAKRLKASLSDSVHDIQQKIEEENNLSFDASCNSHFLLALHSRVITKDYHKGVGHLLSIVDLYEKNEALLNEHQERYLNLLNNCFNNYFLNNDFESFPDLIEKLRSLKPKTSSIRIKINQSHFYYLLLFHLKTQQFTEAIATIPDIESFLKKYGHTISLDRQVTFQYNMAVAYFSAAFSRPAPQAKIFEQRLQSALTKTNSIINEPRFDTRGDIKILSRLLAAIIHIELDQGFIAESILRSTYRFLHKHKQLESIEFLILQHLRRWLYAPDRKEKREVIKSLDLKLEGVAGLEEVKLWLGSK